MNDNVDEKCEEFQIAKVQPQVVAFQPGVAYKIVAYKKSV